MVRVLVIASRPEERDTLETRAAAPGIVVTGTAATWADATPERVDVIVVAGDDLVASGPVGLPDVPPVVVCTSARGAAARVARWGAPGWGVVDRRAPGRQLQAAILAVAEGLCVVPAAGGAASPVDVGNNGSVDEGLPDEPLTARELEVLQLASQGLTNREIGLALKISDHTVKFHLASLYGKLGVSTRTAALRRGLRRGLVSL